jgi:YfiH family protein
MNIKSNLLEQGETLEGIPGGYQFRTFKNHDIAALFTTRNQDFSIRHNGLSRAFALRQEFLTHHGLPAKDLVCLKQVHSSRIVWVGKHVPVRGCRDFELSLPCADGLITDRTDVPLAVFIADCLAVYFFDPRKRIIGLVHAGWRGTAEKISPRLITTLRERFSVSSADLLVAFSPAIRSCCYEVKEDLRSFFPESLIERDGKLFLDLIGENKKQLIAAGIKEENIYDCNICTSCRSNEFFSFRKEKDKAGRMMAAIMIH